MVLGVILSLIAFVVARLIFKTETAKTLAGFLGSVILLISGAFLGELVFGDVDNLIPWIPIVLFLGAIITSPLIVGSWLGTKIMFASEKNSYGVHFPDKSLILSFKSAFFRVDFTSRKKGDEPQFGHLPMTRTAATPQLRTFD